MPATRRELLQYGALVWIGCGRPDEPTANPKPIDDRVLDEILEQLHAREANSEHGLSTHAPMVVETLCTLGAADRAKAWLAGYGGTRLVLPTPHQPIDRDHWRAALGPKRGAATWEAELHRWADWREFFVGELRGGPWQSVLDRWVARLGPGLSAAATHGVIRTSHAVRALSRSDTAPRRAELARGLAYWAAAYEELPARTGTTPVADYATALGKLPRYSTAPGGNIVNGLREVAKLERFGDARDLVATPTDLSNGLAALSAAFTRVYLQHAPYGHAVAFVHAITGPCALRRIAPHVSSATARDAFPYAWQAAAAIFSAYANRDRAAPRVNPKLTPTELVGRAIENGNDHAIKLTEVLLAEHAIRSDVAYLAATEDAIRRL